MPKNKFYYVQSSVSERYGSITMNKVKVNSSSNIGVAITKEFACKVLSVSHSYFPDADIQFETDVNLNKLTDELQLEIANL